MKLKTKLCSLKWIITVIVTGMLINYAEAAVVERCTYSMPTLYEKDWISLSADGAIQTELSREGNKTQLKTSLSISALGQKLLFDEVLYQEDGVTTAIAMRYQKNSNSDWDYRYIVVNEGILTQLRIEKTSKNRAKKKNLKEEKKLWDNFHKKHRNTVGFSWVNDLVQYKALEMTGVQVPALGPNNLMSPLAISFSDITKWPGGVKSNLVLVDSLDKGDDALAVIDWTSRNTSSGLVWTGPFTLKKYTTSENMPAKYVVKNGQLDSVHIVVRKPNKPDIISMSGSLDGRCD